MADIAGNDAGLVKLEPTRQSSSRTHDCSVETVRDQFSAEIRALPFLGALHCPPTQLTAGSYHELVLTYTVGGSGIADSGGLRLCFRYYSDWDLQTEDPAGANYVSVELTGRGALGGAAPQSDADGPRLHVRYDVKGGERPFQKAVIVELEDGYLQPGDTLSLRLGDRRFGGPGTRVQTFVEDDFTLQLLLDVLGTSRLARATSCHLTIVPGPPERLVVHGPRVVRAGSSALLRAHLEDRWGNACVAVPGTLEATRNGHLLACVSLPDQGWAAGALEMPPIPVGSAPTQVCAQLTDGTQLTTTCHLDGLAELPAERAYFADLHVHSHDTVGTQDTAWNIAYGRDIGALDILGYTGNDFQITDADWTRVVQECRATTDEHRFICFPGVEWCGNAGVGGDHNVVFLGDDTTLARSTEWRAGMADGAPQPTTWPIAQLYATYEHDPEGFLLIPHVGGRRAVLDWHHPQLERLIEVHSSWGTSSWFYEEALRQGLRLGASGAGDEHRGRPGGGAPGASIFGGHGGLTGVLAGELTSASVGRALRSRRTWATTGARAVGLLRAGEHWMGDEVMVTAPQIIAEYMLYGTEPWEQVHICDSTGERAGRDLHLEAGLSDDLIRVRWGGARHRNRYRWASWEGNIRVHGATVESVEPWAQVHPEQRVTATADGAHWETISYGADMGVVLRIDDLSAAAFEIDARICESDERGTLRISGRELLETHRHDIPLGGLDLHLCVERIADPAALPQTVTGRLAAQLPSGESVLYVRARQWDGHQVWTSPLFFTRAEPKHNELIK